MQEAVAVAYAEAQHFPGMITPMRSRRIQNSELIASVSNTNSFTATKYTINPGLSGTFPWLSIQAAQWQQYRFHKLCFRYVTRAPTSESGSLILSPEYNVSDTSPSTEQAASNTMDAVEDAVWKSITCTLDVRAMFPLGPRKQIRSGTIAGDYTTYDAGKLFVCTVGSSTNSIGKLWVDYDVELFVPQTSSVTATAAASTSAYGRATSVSFTTATPLAIDFDAATVDALGWGSDTAGVFTPTSGTYRVYFTGTVTNSNANTNVTCSFFKNGVVSYPYCLCSNATAGSNTLALNQVITFSGTDTFAVSFTSTFGAGTSVLAANSASLVITPA